MSDAASDRELLRGMSEIVGRDHPPRPGVYWCDLLLSSAVGYGAATVYLMGTPWSIPLPIQILAWLVAGFALFRLGTFIHEIQHLRSGALRRFKIAWNLVYGIPFLMPSFMYQNHGDHHSLRKYGTREDGEYLPLAHTGVTGLLRYFLEIPLLPILAAFRFGVLVPPSLLHRRLRRRLLERASSYGINLNYRREVSEVELRDWSLAADAAGAAVVWGVVALLLVGVLPWEWLARVYGLAVLALGLNWVRTLFAHRYVRGTEAGDRLDQLADSVTIAGHPLLTELLFPVGLRYHSLHHLFPTIPYHDLGAAHRRLEASLPADAPYRATVFPNARSVWRAFWRDLQASPGLAQPISRS